MRIKISKHIPTKISSIHLLENSAIFIVVLAFVELLSKELHDILKWPMALIGTISIICCFLKYKNGRKKIYILTVALIIIMAEAIFSEGIVLNQYIWDISICFSVALCLYCTDRLAVKKWMVLFIAATVFLLVKYIQSPDGYSVFYNKSRNYISVYEITLLFIVSFVANKVGSQVPSWMIYISTAVSIIAVGRGGIISCLAIMGLYICVKLKKEESSYKRTRKIIALILVLFVAGMIFILYQDYIIEHFFPRFGSTNESRTADHASSIRLTMWSLYIKDCFSSIGDFLFGVNPFLITVRAHYVKDFNIHNSYLLLHAFYGITGIIGFVVCTVNYLRRSWKKYDEITKIIFIGFLIRAMTDHCFPGVLSGILFWFVILIGSDTKNTISIKADFLLKELLHSKS